MCPQIFPQGSTNISALTADDLYIQIVNPPSYIRGAPTDVFGIVGTASYGPVNTPVRLGSGQDGASAFGPLTSASLTDPRDLASDLALVFGQARAESSIEGWAVRVTDGTDVAASAAMVGGVSAAPATITVTGTATAGDTVSPTATSAGLAGSPIVLGPYTVLSTDTPTTIATAIARMVNLHPTLIAAGVTASSLVGVVTIYWPSALSPTITWTAPKTGSTELYAIGSSAAVSAGGTITAWSTGSLGNQTVVSFVGGAAANTTTVRVSGFTGTTEVYTNLPNTGFWAALAAAINLGQGTMRPPSRWVRMTNANAGVAIPGTVPSSVTLAGGTDGRANVTTGIMVGSDVTTPRTGMYSLRGLTPQLAVVWLAGMSDVNVPPTLDGFATSEGCTALFSFAAGSTTASIQASMVTLPRSPALQYLKDWIYWFDPINNQTRLSPPSAVFGGVVCALTPEQSPGNKAASMVMGTERNNNFTGVQPYTTSEVGLLETLGVSMVTNPIPAGPIWGIRHGQTSSIDPATAPFEWWRMTSYLARSFAGTMGQFVDQLQSQQIQDPLRGSVKLMLNQFLDFLVGLRQIDGKRVVCDFSTSASAKPGLGMNTPASVAQHYLFVLVQVTYLASVRFFVLSLQGGTTVVTVGSNTGQQQVSG